MVTMVFQGGHYDKAMSDEINAKHNQPEPFTLYSESIGDLLLEAENFLDGKDIETEEQEQAVASILTRLRREANAADDQRKAEKRPHDEAAKAVQAKWQPLLSKADLAVGVCKNALAKRLEAKEAAQRAAAEAARQEAARQAEAAVQAAASVSDTDLAGQTTLRVLRENAADLEKKAAKLDKKPVRATGGERAVGLRASYSAEVIDPKEFGRWLWENRREEYLAFLTARAIHESKNGDRGIPGIRIITERKAA